MKREIKFRGRRLDNGEWVYGYLVVDPKGQYEIYWQPFQAATSNTYHIIDPETVGQYTGLKDKNGKNIYESDILHDEWSHVGVVKRSENESISAFITVWDDGDECCIFNDAAHADIVVAGNIYENPEL